jgi:serpin B
MRQPTGTDPDSTATLVTANTAFALDLHTQLASGGGNSCFCPYSISVTFAMTCAGARGETARQIASALHLPLGQATHAGFADLEAALTRFARGGSVTLRSANRLWPQKTYPLRQEFLQLLAEAFRAELEAVDYRNPGDARDRINRWIDERTAGRIKNLISPGTLNALTRLVLVNAVYFKARWRHQFKAHATAPHPFTLASGRQVTARMMRQVADFRYLEDGDLQALEMPYVDPDLAMVILLPRRRDGLAELERRLTAPGLQSLFTALTEESVDVLLPRFRMDARFALMGAMQAFGVRDAFDMDRADFSGMDGRSQWLYIGAAVHASFVAVDEEGTEAAAATAVFIKEFSRRLDSFEEPRVFQADHPFLYLIRQQSTGNILFLGRLADPTA